MSEDKKDKLVQYDEDGVISSISSLANIGITTKDNPITSVLNFSALSTKMSRCQGTVDARGQWHLLKLTR